MRTGDEIDENGYPLKKISGYTAMALIISIVRA